MDQCNANETLRPCGAQWKCGVDSATVPPAFRGSAGFDSTPAMPAGSRFVIGMIVSLPDMPTGLVAAIDSWRNTTASFQTYPGSARPPHIFGACRMWGCESVYNT